MVFLSTALSSVLLSLSVILSATLTTACHPVASEAT